MADSARGEGVGRDEITQLPGTARPPSTGSAASNRQRRATNAAPTGPRRPPSIRIRRLTSTPAVPQINGPDSGNGLSNSEGERTGRRRASSAPMRPNLPPDLVRQPAATATHLPALPEEVSGAPPATADAHLGLPAEPSGRMRSGSQRLRRFGSNIGARIAPPPAPPTAEDEYEAEIVDLLDVVGV